MGAPSEPTTASPPWSLVGRILFRFAFVYQVLYILPFPVYLLATLVPVPAVAQYVSQWVVKPYRDFWDAIVLWVGKQLFDVEITFRPAGSGDTTWNYVQVFCFVVLATVLTLLWSLLGRKRPRYDRLHGGLRVYVRFYLAVNMISYGVVKVIKTQFPNPNPDWLLTAYGESSPMRLLWTFMGASEGYNVFTGAGEMLGGLLLCTRRTTLLGALVTFAVMSQVAALNYCYDVPVKLFSTHLLLMAIFLTVPDLSWLANVFVLGRRAEPRAITPLVRRKWLNWTLRGLRTAVVLAYVGLSLYRAYEGRKTYGDLAPRPPLYGLWAVEEFEDDGKVRPPLTTDAARWRHVILTKAGPTGNRFGLVETMTGVKSYYGVEVDPEQNTITLSRRGGPPDSQRPALKFDFTYQEPEPDLLVIEGTLDNRRLRARLRHVDESEFLLVNRGFHWINELPYNVSVPRGTKPPEPGRGR
jgi:hypothetical protein